MTTEYNTTHEYITELIAQLNDIEVNFFASIFEDYAAAKVAELGPDAEPFKDMPGIAIMAEQLSDELENRGAHDYGEEIT